MIKLITGNAHKELSQDIAKNIGLSLTNAEVGAFPDGETIVQINENIRGRDVFLIQPTCPPTNQNIMELLIMADAAKRASADRITAVIPFFGYARQDRKDQPRVPITSKLVADLLQTAGFNRVLTVDLHAGQIPGFFNIPVDHLYSAPIILDHLKKQNTDNLVVVSPDVGGIKMTHAYSTALGVDMAIVSKRRLSATNVEAVDLIGDVDGKDILIVDDMTETAGTLLAAGKLLKSAGAKQIRACVTHGVLDQVAIDRIEDSVIEELICTDSTPHAKKGGPKVTVVSIAPLLAKAIDRIHNDKSVSSLFDIIK